jgi:hypothetical protein
MPGYDGIVDFWEWYERRLGREQNSVASLALDKCEESLRRRQWDRFSYWYAIYRRERPKAPRGGLKRTGK